MDFVINKTQIDLIIEAINCAALRLEVLEMYIEKTENTKIILQFLKDAKGELKYIEKNNQLQ